MCSILLGLKIYLSFLQLSGKEHTEKGLLRVTSFNKMNLNFLYQEWQ